MDKPTFTSLFKDLISRLYDPTILETHPLADSFPLPDGAPARRAEGIRRLILEEIEQLRPPGKEIILQSPEWRPYLILHKRYVEGLPPLEIAAALYIGDRQFRRDHSRALQALSTLIWERYFQPAARQPENGEADGDQNGFEPHAEKLDLNEIVMGVAAVLARRLEIEAVRLDLQPAPGPAPVFADRVILRQILLSLLNYILHLRGRPEIVLRTNPGPPVSMRISFETDEQWASIQGDELDSLGLVRRLSRQIPARLVEAYPSRGAAGPAEIAVEFAPPQARVALIVDDQPAAQKMYQRYLSRTDLEVVGLTDPTAAVSTARQVQPALLILDVMMPRVDGWEVLQALQLDPQTRHIPVVVCSAWGEPELARSLEAAAFLKKPVVQKDLLDVLTRLNIITG
jgi:CheY-like chemotaxis protein